jgi:hypothetical protein
MATTAAPLPRPSGTSLPIAPGAAEPPPFRLPGEHFVAALLWLGAGAAGLVLVAGDLARGNLFDPRVLATTHAFTLGVVTTSIFGALYQLFPVTMGAGVRNVRAGHATFWMLELGILLLVVGFWVQRGWLEGAGWVVLTLALGGLTSNLVVQRRGATQGRIIGRYVAAGHAALGTAMLIAFGRIGETLGWWHVDRLAIIASHYHVAALGFATLTAVGVGSRMLPMFLLAHGYPEWPLRWIGPLAGLGLTAFAAGQLGRIAPLTWAGAWLMAAAALLHLYLVLGYFRTRTRRRLDPGLAHMAAAFTGLGVTAAGGITLLAAPGGFNPRGWAAYGLAGLLGWLVLLIIGVYYRILPFLTWLHLFGGRMGEPDLPTVADLTRPAWGWASLACLVSGLLVMVPAVALGAATPARAGAILVALGVALVLAQALRVLALRRRA